MPFLGLSYTTYITEPLSTNLLKTNTYLNCQVKDLL